MLCIRPQSDTAETVRLMGNSIGVKKEKKKKKRLEFCIKLHFNKSSDGFL